jgi:ribonuclease HI
MEMPWIEASLRGQKVLARTKADGTLDVSGGRVEIRYRPGDAKAYRAAAGNLVVAPDARVQPDDTCVAGADPEGASDKASKRVTKTDGQSPVTMVRAQWIAYTDGACSGNPGPAGAGMVVIAPGGKIHEGYEYLGSATNNVAELTAVLRGVESIPRDAESVAIHTDSKYAIGVLTLGWKAKANTDLILRARAALAGRNVRLVYVPGHAGVPMNERADELAREAVRSAGSQALPKLEGAKREE